MISTRLAYSYQLFGHMLHNRGLVLQLYHYAITFSRLYADSLVVYASHERHGCQ